MRKRIALGITAFEDIIGRNVFYVDKTYFIRDWFTDQEVFDALVLYGLSDQKKEVDYWYDGFQFGQHKGIYNPWSILNYLRDGKFEPYWVNTSSNALVGKLVREGSLRVKDEFETLLKGESVVTEIDEAITYAELEGNSKTIWSWFLTTGYVKIVQQQDDRYEIRLTNREVQEAFYKLVKNGLRSLMMNTQILSVCC